MSTSHAYRLAASRVSDRRTRPPLPSASWLSDAHSALTPLGRLSARAVLALLAFVALALATTTIGLPRPAGAQGLPKGVIKLTSQDPWVQSSSIPVRLGLSVNSPIPAKYLLVDLALYTEPDQSALASRYEFDATTTGQLAGWTSFRSYPSPCSRSPRPKTQQASMSGGASSPATFRQMCLRTRSSSSPVRPDTGAVVGSTRSRCPL